VAERIFPNVAQNNQFPTAEILDHSGLRTKWKKLLWRLKVSC